jgi:hypothetical protein
LICKPITLDYARLRSIALASRVSVAGAIMGEKQSAASAVDQLSWSGAETVIAGVHHAIATDLERLFIGHDLAVRLGV